MKDEVYRVLEIANLNLTSSLRVPVPRKSLMNASLSQVYAVTLQLHALLAAFVQARQQDREE